MLQRGHEDEEAIRLTKTVAAIPALNEENTIAKIILHSMKWVSQVLVVDDGSTDDTALIARKLGAVVIRHERNLGKGAAAATVSSGLEDQKLTCWLPLTETANITLMTYLYY